MTDKSKFLLISLGVVIVIAAVCTRLWYQSNFVKDEQADKIAIQNNIESFSKVLKKVSLLSPTAGQDIQNNYKDYVTPGLLVEWQKDPLKALGRFASSPWPSEIEISDISPSDSNAYKVRGKLIEITGQEKVNSGVTNIREVELSLIDLGSRWLISNVILYPYVISDSWKTSNSQGIEFRYPEKLTTRYIVTREWPPVVKIQSGIFSCVETPHPTNSSTLVITQRMVDNRTYCVEVKHESAVTGNDYVHYTYTIPKNGKLILISFVLEYPACDHYDKERNQACTNEYESFDLGRVVDRMVQSVKWDLSQADNN